MRVELGAIGALYPWAGTELLAVIVVVKGGKKWKRNWGEM
ncbi:hypothetical protein FOMG_09055 [Fusarium oxysporum f. sp. melonis 26406]|uniref:Uncharacterized protein n=1 Tax=Fusarium oxysporum f. sp. melonis 26406 TaxID=1089452 RepID=X0ARX7_FUSOX|nr:hypothetical protein FOMG_09055 [Fusarium oxysporum f. sp. melonis 26406]